MTCGSQDAKYNLKVKTGTMLSREISLNPTFSILFLVKKQCLYELSLRKAAWKLDWGPNSSNFTVELWIGEAQVVMRAEWVQLLLQSVVIPAENDDGLECVKLIDL